MIRIKNGSHTTDTNTTTTNQQQNKTDDTRTGPAGTGKGGRRVILHPLAPLVVNHTSKDKSHDDEDDGSSWLRKRRHFDGISTAARAHHYPNKPKVTKKNHDENQNYQHTINEEEYQRHRFPLKLKRHGVGQGHTSDQQQHQGGGGLSLKLGYGRWSLQPSRISNRSHFHGDVRPLSAGPPEPKRCKIDRTACADFSSSTESSPSDLSVLAPSSETPYDVSTSLDSADSGIGTSAEAETGGLGYSRRARRRLCEEEEQFLIRRRTHLVHAETLKRDRNRKDLLSTLPDEMLMKILIFLPKVTLGRVAQVNKRLNCLVTEETLWRRIDCLDSVLTTDHVHTLMKRRPVYLRLARASIPNCELVGPTQISFLDLSMALITPSMLNTVLGACPSLQKLSLEHLELDSTVLETSLIFAHSIEALNMAMCSNVDGNSLSVFLGRCKKLKALNLACIKQDWCSDILTKVMISIPAEIEELNLSGFREKLTDTHFMLFAHESTSLMKLDLSDCQVLTRSSINALLHLKSIYHLSLSRCYGIDAAGYASLIEMLPHLRFLDLFSLFKDSSVEIFSRALPGVNINAWQISTIARPTVSGENNTIWGQRVN